jgi:hypothetical protein
MCGQSKDALQMITATAPLENEKSKLHRCVYAFLTHDVLFAPVQQCRLTLFLPA